MSNEWVAIGVYLFPILLILIFYVLRQKKNQQINHQFLIQSRKDGLTEAASLHPVINAIKCIGCGACVSACPEHNVIGLVDRFAQLVNPTNCIGHGACKEACPEDAITLVFGNATRGIDIPEISPKFETNIRGMFIAGELGGMGLIKNAVEQGRQAMNSIVEYIPNIKRQIDSKLLDDGSIVDCVVVGSGPAGISAMLGAKEKQLNIITLEQDSVGGTVSHFPKGKLVMTAPANLPIEGKVKFSEVSKEKLLVFWLNIIKKHQLIINENEEMQNIERHADGTFTVASSKRQYRTFSVLLAIGRRGSPRKLGVSGEQLPKVVYRLNDPEQYQNEDVMVVGGGDSALEAACSIAELTNCRVSISYRNGNFNRAKQKNRERVQRLVVDHKLTLYLNSHIQEISELFVKLTIAEEVMKIDNNKIIICAGGVLPTPFLKKIGIEVTTKYGTA